MIKVQVIGTLVKEYANLTERYRLFVEAGGETHASIKDAREHVEDARAAYPNTRDAWAYIDSSGLVFLLRFSQHGHFIILGAARPAGVPVQDVYDATGKE